MGYVSLTRHLEVTPEVAFDHITRVDRLPRWLTLLTGVRAIADRLDHVGAKFDGELHVGGRELHTTWEVTRAEPPRFVHLNGTSPEVEATVYLSTAAWGGGCDVELELDYELAGGVLTHTADRLYLERAVARELEESLIALQEVLEEHRPAAT